MCCRRCWRILSLLLIACALLCPHCEKANDCSNLAAVVVLVWWSTRASNPWKAQQCWALAGHCSFGQRKHWPGDKARPWLFVDGRKATGPNCILACAVVGCEPQCSSPPVDATALACCRVPVRVDASLFASVCRPVQVGRYFGRLCYEDRPRPMPPVCRWTAPARGFITARACHGVRAPWTLGCDAVPGLFYRATVSADYQS